MARDTIQGTAAIMAIAYIFYLMKIGFDEAEHR